MKTDPNKCVHHNIHPGRVDGAVTVCLDCETPVVVQTMHRASGESTEEQFQTLLTALGAAQEDTRRRCAIDDIIYWIRSDGPEGEDLVEMYYKGRCTNPAEGRVGHDVKCRPVALGPGEYTGVVGGSDVRWSKWSRW